METKMLKSIQMKDLVSLQTNTYNNKRQKVVPKSIQRYDRTFKSFALAGMV